MIKAVIFDFNGVIYTGDYDSDLLDFIKSLKQDYKIGMITNYSQEGYEKYVAPIKDYFDDILVSSKVGIHKPDPRIYQLAAKNLGVGTRECIYIDNHDFRVAGAEQVGMKGIAYLNFNQMKAELTKILSAGADN
jgi:putative hydrolase of the HAD superfamily